MRISAQPTPEAQRGARGRAFHVFHSVGDTAAATRPRGEISQALQVTSLADWRAGRFRDLHPSSF